VPHRFPIAAAGVVCLRGGEVLLIRRGTPPRLGQWSLPGGKINWGEAASAAALRELKEETGVDAEIIRLLDVVDALPASAEAPHHLLIDYAARWIRGEPRAGDDAADAAFFPLEEALARVEWSETRRIILQAAELGANGE
jgi:8-oxo-dGTP diphosphatase